MSLGFAPLATLPLATLPTTSSSGNYTLTCSAGAYVYTGNNATLTYARVLTCSAGAYSYVGQNATLTYGRVLTCQPGAYIYTGNDAVLTYAVPGVYTLTCNAGAYSYVGNDATLTYVPIVPIGHSGGDDGWKKEKPKKRKDDYKTNIIARKQAVLDAYNGLLEPETTDAIAEEVKNVIQLTPIVDLDLSKVRKLLALWEQELNRREEDDDEEAILLLL